MKFKNEFITNSSTSSYFIIYDTFDGFLEDLRKDRDIANTCLEILNMKENDNIRVKEILHNLENKSDKQSIKILNLLKNGELVIYVFMSCNDLSDVIDKNKIIVSY